MTQHLDGFLHLSVELSQNFRRQPELELSVLVLANGIRVAHKSSFLQAEEGSDEKQMTVAMKVLRLTFKEKKKSKRRKPKNSYRFKIEMVKGYEIV